ncbi:hypothetical protein T4E_10916 [Trichinella pseudospiralis]|uniref:Uncharacterized protein n=1 Tax=Trichinella pseudospiralis TaxID=6337 RepID=A0A0V0XD38_TRIPS|nr:hypothetical protein T4E_10916 [Trichinella pseudospiralis]
MCSGRATKQSRPPKTTQLEELLAEHVRCASKLRVHACMGRIVTGGFNYLFDTTSQSFFIRKDIAEVPGLMGPTETVDFFAIRSRTIREEFQLGFSEASHVAPSTSTHHARDNVGRPSRPQSV